MKVPPLLRTKSTFGLSWDRLCSVCRRSDVGLNSCDVGILESVGKNIRQWLTRLSAVGRMHGNFLIQAKPNDTCHRSHINRNPRKVMFVLPVKLPLKFVIYGKLKRQVNHYITIVPKLISTILLRRSCHAWVMLYPPPPPPHMTIKLPGINGIYLIIRF